MEWNETKMENAYTIAKTACIRSSVYCPVCGKLFTKVNNKQAFCGTRGPKNKKGKKTLCKDQYWNFIKKERQLGGVRGYYLGNVSMQKLIEYEDRIDDYQNNNFEDDHPFSGSGLGQD